MKLKKINRIYRSLIYTLRFRNSRSQKIFCIGRNKTGTTSIAELLSQLGFYVAPQWPAEVLAISCLNNDFRRLCQFVRYCGEAFQDIPFSLPDTYKILDQNFPDSKFILTIRDSPEVWYKSVTSSHAKLFGNGRIPDKTDLKKAKYIYTGWMWKLNRLIYNTPEDDLYNEAALKSHYIGYNTSVISYFEDSPDKLLVINLKDKNAGARISEFLGVEKIIVEMPWENRT